MRHSARSVRTCLAALLLATTGVVTASAQPGNGMFRPVTGAFKILIIRVNYPDDASNPLSTANAITNANALRTNMETLSYNRAYPVSVEVAGLETPLTMPNNKTYYNPAGGPTRLPELRADAIAAAKANGFPGLEDTFHREIIVTAKVWPSNAINWAGFNQRTVWSSVPNPVGWFHELGHTHGFQHATVRNVEPGAHPEGPGGQINYGDLYAPMGSQQDFAHYNPWEAQRIGWLQATDVQTVTQPGTYRIRALESTPTGTAPLALRIARQSGEDYWIYYRTAFEATQAGPLIRWAYRTNTKTSPLLDMDTTTSPTTAIEPLAEGNTFFSLAGEFAIHALNVQPVAGYVDVQIAGVLPQPDVLPVIDITSPARGVTVNNTAVYTATAYDPDVGTANGAGIQSVVLSIYDNLGQVENWLAGVGPEPTPAATSGPLTTAPYSWNPDAVLPTKVYYLVVTAESTNAATNRMWFAHLIDTSAP